MYYNKRLHPRQYVVEHHQDGCMLHELEEQTKITRHSSLAALGRHPPDVSLGSTATCDLRTPRRRLSSAGSASSASPITATNASRPVDLSPFPRRDYSQRPQSIAVSTPAAVCDWSISVAERMRNVSNVSNSSANNVTCTTTPIKSPPVHHYHAESDDSASTTNTTASIRSHCIKPSLSRKTSALSLLKNVHFSRDCIEHSATVQHRHTDDAHDSPEQIIASLFPEQVPRGQRAKSVPSTPVAAKPMAARPGGVLKATKSSASRSIATSAPSTGRKTQLVASPGFGTRARARVVYRPDSLQELRRDFEGIKYAMCF